VRVRRSARADAASADAGADLKEAAAPAPWRQHRHHRALPQDLPAASPRAAAILVAEWLCPGHSGLRSTWGLETRAGPTRQRVGRASYGLWFTLSPPPPR